MIKSCIVIGAGNAGRPVARLLNHQGVEVTLSDSKVYEEFTEIRQHMLDVLKGEGVKLELGNSNPDITGYDAIYLAPTIPKTAPIFKQIEENSIEIITRKTISDIINNILDMDKIGITGSYGKTTTTTMITNIFKKAGYKVYQCSSMKWNLVSEALVEDIVNEEYKGANLAILELPHGTLGLLGDLDLKMGVLTNLHQEHLSEFDGSMEKYIERKSLIMNISDKLVANIQCADLLTNKREDTIYFNFENNNTEIDTQKYEIKYAANYQSRQYTFKQEGSSEKTDINIDTVASYNYANLTAAIAVSLEYGISWENIKEGLALFSGVSGRMEHLGTYNGVEAYFDSSCSELSIRQALDFIKDENIIVVFGCVDSTTIRDYEESGRTVGDYANMVIATGYVEITGELHMDSALGLLNSIENDDVIKLAVCTVDEASELAMKYAKPGDYIVHLGIGGTTSYKQVKDKLLKGLEEGCKRYANN
ncbi:MAG: UDP-N-acetylmuramoylalanine--D-glutamate ligase [Methanosphaera sp.]|nr:UDP-N-acetylmuramoylalanine--D-glutamate ligase [Methanosphaera sp.]